MVYLDTGTTALYLADLLRNPKALFVTSSIDMAGRLSAYKRRVYVLDGTPKSRTVDVVGTESLESLRRYNFAKAFLGTSGVSISRGFTTPDPDAAALKVPAATHAQIVYMLTDSSKFGRVTATTILPLESAKIITDCLPDQRYLNRTEVIVA